MRRDRRLHECAARRPVVHLAPETTLRVMTYNIHAGHGDIDRTAATIRALSPDIVGLEEVDVHALSTRRRFCWGT